jgi:hypothetical protein
VLATVQGFAGFPFRGFDLFRCHVRAPFVCVVLTRHGHIGPARGRSVAEPDGVNLFRSESLALAQENARAIRRSKSEKLAARETGKGAASTSRRRRRRATWEHVTRTPKRSTRNFFRPTGPFCLTPTSDHWALVAAGRSKRASRGSWRGVTSAHGRTPIRESRFLGRGHRRGHAGISTELGPDVLDFEPS